MASSNEGRGALSQRPSDLTITEQDNERRPLLGDNHKASDYGQGAPSDVVGLDATTLYARALHQYLPWYKRPSALWLLPILGTMWISGGMLMSSKSQFHAVMLCREYMNRHSTNTTILGSLQSGDTFEIAMRPPIECEVPEIQAFTAKIVGLVDVLTALGATMTIGYYTSFSDRHGRKPIILLALFAVLLGYINMVIMNEFWDQVGFPLLIVDTVINGLMGGISLPYIGGSIVRATGTIMTVLYIDIVLVTLSLVLGVVVLPESLPSKQTRVIRELYESYLSPGQQPVQEHVPFHTQIVHSLRFFKPNGRNTNTILLAIISFLGMLTYRGTLSVVVLYTNQMFNWTEYEDGILFSLAYLVRLLSMMAVLPALAAVYKWSFAKKQRKALAKAGKLPDQANSSTNISTSIMADHSLVSESAPGTSSSSAAEAVTTGRTRAEVFSDIKFDTWMVRLGYFISSVTFLSYGLVREGWAFYVVFSLHSLATVASPAIKALLTMMVEPSQFGAILGALQVVDSIASVASPLAISWVYALTVKSMPQFVWYTLALWAGICFVLSFMIRQKEFRSGYKA
ncbi:hypothetical protein BGX31_009044 [Mortierella sp. GBA43]|nr:hypothetical protein BGX31_009044 [Mortierella sp. GBA43]